MNMNNSVWYQLKEFKQQTDIHLYRFRWYLRLTLTFTAATLLLLAAFFAGIFE